MAHKISAANITEGMTIKVAALRANTYEAEGYTHTVLLGSVRKSSPTLTVTGVVAHRGHGKGIRSVTITTAEGPVVMLGTSQRVEVQ